MTFPATSRSTTLVKQVLISGSVRDMLTNGPPLGQLSVQLIDRGTGDAYPLPGRVHFDGRFAFYGSPETAFPLLDQQTYHLRIEASAPNYQPVSHEFDVAQVAGQPDLVSRPVPVETIPDIQVRLFTTNLPVSNITLDISRTPVTLRGRVHVFGDPTTGVDNAFVAVIGETGTLGDSEGYFELPNPLPLEVSMEIMAVAVGHEFERITFEPDYSKPVNYISIGLRPRS